MRIKIWLVILLSVSAAETGDWAGCTPPGVQNGTETLIEIGAGICISSKWFVSWAKTRRKIRRDKQIRNKYGSLVFYIFFGSAAGNEVTRFWVGMSGISVIEKKACLHTSQKGYSRLKSRAMSDSWVRATRSSLSFSFMQIDWKHHLHKLK